MLDERQLAVELLADIGSRDAIPVFVRNIEYFQNMIVWNDSPLNGYPCALALARVGQSSVPVVFVHLQTSSPDQVTAKALRLYASVFLAIYGQNEGGHHEAIAVVERAATRAFQKENLQRLLVELQERSKNRR